MCIRVKWLICARVGMPGYVDLPANNAIIIGVNFQVRGNFFIGKLENSYLSKLNLACGAYNLGK